MLSLPSPRKSKAPIRAAQLSPWAGGGEAWPGGGTAAAAAACGVAVSTLFHGAFHSQPLYTLFIEGSPPDTKTQLHTLLYKGGLAVVTLP